jgi:hypothetical protein
MFVLFAHMFASPVFLIAYLLGAVIAGMVGRKTRIGYWGHFFAAILFTPIISLLFIFFTSPSKAD